MASDEDLAIRTRHLLAKKRAIVEKNMFGGIGFLDHGNMVVAIWKHWLIARVGVEAAADLQFAPHAKVMDLTGRPMKGWLMIAPAGLATAEELKSWIDRAMKFVRTLPPK